MKTSFRGECKGYSFFNSKFNHYFSPDQPNFNFLTFYILKNLSHISSFIFSLDQIHEYIINQHYFIVLLTIDVAEKQ